LSSPLVSLRILQIFSIGWQVLAFAFITLFLPQSLLPVGIIGFLTGVSLSTASVLRGRSDWAKFSILEMWFVFYALLISQALTNTIGQYLPITLLQSVMILFAFEVLTISCEFQEQLSNGASLAGNSTGSEGLPHRSARYAFKAVSRLGLLFASCYVISLAILFLGASAALTTPLITDISLYIIVVSVSLALLLVLRED
jgi:hypothetical protein